MKGFIKVVKEVNETLNNIIVFEIILNSIMIFLMVYVVLSVSTLNVLYALLPAVVYFIVVSYERVKKNKARIVEEKYAKSFISIESVAKLFYLSRSCEENATFSCYEIVCSDWGVAPL